VSFQNANSRFSRRVSVLRSDGAGGGGVAALPTEDPNTPSVAIEDAALGTIGSTPTGALWRKISMTDAIQWFPLAGGGNGLVQPLLFPIAGIQTKPTVLIPTFTAPVSMFLIDVWSLAVVDNSADVLQENAPRTLLMVGDDEVCDFAHVSDRFGGVNPGEGPSYSDKVTTLGAKVGSDPPNTFPIVRGAFITPSQGAFAPYPLLSAGQTITATVDTQEWGGPVPVLWIQAIPVNLP